MPGNTRGIQEPASLYDLVFTNPALARTLALERLSSTDPIVKAEGLWALGKLAFENNAVDDAISYLTQAKSLAASRPHLSARIDLSTATVWSSQGRSADALDLLEGIAAAVADHDRYLLHQQRMVVLFDLGRVADAYEAQHRAHEAALQDGNEIALGRSHANLGSLASLLGLLDESIEHYRNAKAVVDRTDQRLISAGISGNLGYVSSRRGDFAAAFRWYDQALEEFATVPDADRSRAVVHNDRAQTLLDAGLFDDALDAARSAEVDAGAGGNAVLAARAQLVAAEALVRLGRGAEAQSLLDRAVEPLGDASSVLAAWAQLLRIEASMSSDVDATGASSTDDEVAALSARADEFVGAGWQDALLDLQIRCVAEALEDGDRALAGRAAEPIVAGLSITDSAGRLRTAYLDAARAFTAGEPTGAVRALHAARRAAGRWGLMLGPAELQAQLAEHIRRICQLGCHLSLDAESTSSLLRWTAEGSGAMQTVRREPDQEFRDLLVARRNLVVSTRENRQSGKDADSTERALRDVEHSILHRIRTAPSTASSPSHSNSSNMLDVRALRARLGGSEMVVYSECQGELYAIHVNASRCARTELGPMNRIGALISEQRVLIRRLAAGADAKTSSADRLVAIGIELDHILLRQLALSDQGGLVVAPSPCLHALSWSHLPLLRDRAFSVANDVKRWRPADFASNAPRRVGIVLGPSLEHGISEADDVESLYEAAGIQRHRTTTVAGTVQIFDKVDLLHIVAHGDFRTDNPLFSSIHLDDGPMDVLDLEQTTSAPHLVVLSSCQGGETRLGGGGQLSGTTSSLLRLGVRSVIAPLTIVPDVQSHPFMIDLHSALLTGALADDALRVARSRANGRGDGANLALASTFHVFA